MSSAALIVSSAPNKDIYNYMGKVVIKNGSLIGISHIDEQGHLTNTFDLPNGVYYFKELQIPINDPFLITTFPI